MPNFVFLLFSVIEYDGGLNQTKEEHQTDEMGSSEVSPNEHCTLSASQCPPSSNFKQQL